MKTEEENRAYHKAYRIKNRERRNAYNKAYLENNPDKLKSKREKSKDYYKGYYQNNKAKKSEALRAWRTKNPDYRKLQYKKDPAKFKAAVSKWRDNHPSYGREYLARRRKIDAEFRIVENLRRRINHVIRSARKSARSMVLIGCDPQFLKGYLEARFKKGMTWDNYGNEWHIDHRIPCAEFDLAEESQQRQCFHYTNLQPLWSSENLKKGDSLPQPHQAELI